MGEAKLKCGINFQTRPEGIWSFGICLSHWEPETYLYINFFKWTISIGKFYH
jgi:hypothetical protein